MYACHRHYVRHSLLWFCVILRASALFNLLMADPNPKRAKMDNPNGQSSSTSPKDRKMEQQLIKTWTQDFEEIRNMPGFVDHTHFIRSFLKQPRLAIFAPRRFGKSSHLNMVQKFLQIDADKTTGEVSSSVYGPANGRNNYKLFEGTRIITDNNNKKLVEDHLGKHPVIHLDLKGTSINSVEAAEMRCRIAVHEAFKNHLYLITSTKLVPGNDKLNADCQNICYEWCSEVRYKMQDLDNSLVILTQFLYNHFNKAKVYILVDEFDAINASALSEIPKANTDDSRVAKLRTICNIVGDLLGPVTKGCDLVAGALFTGVSYVSGLGYSLHFNNFIRMKFLDGTKIIATHEDFVPFYGATREEVESLIQKLVENKQLVMFEGKEKFLNDTNELDVKKIMNDVQSRYNGYFDKKRNRIFCLWSVLQYLESGIARNYWNQTDGITDLYKILKCGKVAYEIIKLMRGGMIEFLRCDEITIENLVELHDLILKNEDEVDSEVVFNFLMDQGYLTYPEDFPEGGVQDKKFKLPNAEILAALSKMVGDIVKKHWKIDATSCTSLINDISLSVMKDKKELQTMMSKVYKAISSILRQLEKTNRSLVNEARMMCVMYKVLNDAESFVLSVDMQIKCAEGKLITSHRPDFLMHKNEEKCSILWELKFNEDCKTEQNSSLYALQEARGILPTKNGTYKNYMKPVLKNLERETLVIGLSMDSDIRVSLSYALNKDEWIFFRSEKEPISFPKLYQLHKAVSLPPLE